MRKSVRHRHGLLWLAVACVLLGVAAPPRENATPVPVRLAVVVNGERPETDVTLAQLRRIYLGEQRFWSDGTPIHGVLPPQAEPELIDAFLRHAIGLPPDEFWRHWRGIVFRGLNNRQPRSMPSTPATLRAVYRSKIPIALVPADGLPDREVGVRALAVDGKSIDDPDYPLNLAVPEHGAR